MANNYDLRRGRGNPRGRRGDADDRSLPASIVPRGFADMPEDREKFEIRRKVYTRLRKEYKKLRAFRPDMRAMKQMNDENISYRYPGCGSTPGVEVGDTFQFRSEMFVVGLHQAPVAGICCADRGGGDMVARSIVQSGGYEDNDDQGHTLIYSGHGGNDYDGSKQQIADQRQTTSNDSMRRSMQLKHPVRVIRGLNVQGKKGWNKIYSYDGLYSVIRELPPQVGKSGHQVFKFELKRRPGQPEIDITRVAFGGNNAINDAGL